MPQNHAVLPADLV